MLPNNTEIDEAAIRTYRLERVRQGLRASDFAGLLLFDPVNIRYATGSRNMQVWTMHNPCRYLFIATDGPVILFELGSARHLAKHLTTIDEIRPAWAWDYMIVGERNEEMAGNWAGEIVDLIQQHGGGNRRIAIDRADWLPVMWLQHHQLQVADGKPLMERARAVKSAEEITALQISFQACADSIAVLRKEAKPGMSESAALGMLLKEAITRGGEYPETRLLSSGPRTNPWFQETADRVMQDGDLLSFDTDLIGRWGFYTDISRSWVIGDRKPTDEQKRLYNMARQQLEHNTALLRPGMSFREMSAKSWPVPAAYLANRYADIAHGVGLGVEYPLIWYQEDEAYGMYDGVFQENMVVCVESYIGAVGGREGVKLEQPVLITADGPQLFCDCPYEDY
ncbi:MAG TPA: Xaa-Pro peptidase family protein [Dongiaceae bacterium]|nr:Xaa-Pro peptidase family protein [Dongiaceae bacterium]